MRIKKRPLVLLVFLLMLCIMVPVKPANATYGDVSPESITSFSETLPDDVLFYPDGLQGSDDADPSYDGEILFDVGPPADDITTNAFTSYSQGVEGDVDGSLINEPSMTDGFGSIRIKLDFTISSFHKHVTTITLAFTAYTADSLGGSSNEFSSQSITSDGAYIVDELAGLDPVECIKVEVTFTGGVADDDTIIITLDNVLLYAMTLTDADHYGESFAGVSDITVGTGETITTDGDLGTFHTPGDAAWDLYYMNDISSDVDVIEFRFISNITGGNFGVALYSDDNGGGSLLYNTGNIGFSTTTLTKKFSCFVTGVESIRLAFNAPSSATATSFDYLRAGPANETGWQHDGSTTEGVSDDSAADMTYTSSTDGDILTLNASLDAGAGASAYGNFYIDVDPTATEIDLELDYYQFFEVRYRLTGDSNVHGIRPQWDLLQVTDMTISKDNWITVRCNVKASSIYSADNRVRFYAFLGVGWSAQLEIDWVKSYSIANWSYTGVAVETDDFCYVESDALVFDIDGYPEYILWNHDPVLSVDTTIYTAWNMTIADEDPTANIDYSINFYIPADDPPTQNDLTSGDLNRGTLTDFYFSVYYPNTVSAIKFIDTRDWQDIHDMELIFPVGWDPTFQFGYDAFFIFLGLIMIPASTMYFVRGGKDDMSRDKLFYFLIAFIIGWSLVIGGIMP